MQRMMNLQLNNELNFSRNKVNLHPSSISLTCDGGIILLKNGFDLQYYEHLYIEYKQMRMSITWQTWGKGVENIPQVIGNIHGLSQDLETGCPKLAIKFFGASKFLRGTTIYSDFNHKHVQIHQNKA